MWLSIMPFLSNSMSSFSTKLQLLLFNFSEKGHASFARQWKSCAAVLTQQSFLGRINTADAYPAAAECHMLVMLLRNWLPASPPAAAVGQLVPMRPV
jgi:hypothetical protein